MNSTDNNAPEPDLPEEPEEEGEELLPLHPPGTEAAPGAAKPAAKTPPPRPTPLPAQAPPQVPVHAPAAAPHSGVRRTPQVTPPAGLPSQGPMRPSGSVPAGQPPVRPSGSVPAGQPPMRPSGAVPAGRRSGMSPASSTPPAGAPVPASSSGKAASPAAVAGTMEAIQLLISLRGAANKVKQLTVVDQISHGLQSLGIKMPDSKGETPAMKTPTHAVPATAFIELLAQVLNEARKAKQFSLAERVRSGLEALGYSVSEGTNHQLIIKRVKA